MNVISLESLSKFTKIEHLEVNPRIRAVLRKITPDAGASYSSSSASSGQAWNCPFVAPNVYFSAFDLKSMFLAMEMFQKDPMVCSKVSAVIKDKLGVDSWAALLEV